MGRNRWVALPIAFTMIILTSGCSTVITSVTRGFAENLSSAILNNPDLEMVRAGAPSYLILIDSLVAGSPDNAYLLEQSAYLHSVYAVAFVDEEARAKLLHTKAKQQALTATCLALKDACGLDTQSFKVFEAWVGDMQSRDVPILFTLSTSWLGWIQAHSEDFSAIAELARVKAMMTKIAELRPGYDDGSVYLYLGVFETLLPPAMGGKPELGREYFERAIALSNGQNLLIKVMFADQYARLMFDRELHDRLLKDVLAAPREVLGLTLMNTVAKEQAADLLASADEYF
ncbi:MAG: TRAP transporter TatT component family protein [Pseudomonadota bacterium]|nr:TRAP transporter TatT component family protein [Pseudomonadota bacterium]